VLNNELDLAVVGPRSRIPTSHPSVCQRRARGVAPAGHKLAGSKGLALKDLEDQPFVMRDPRRQRWSLERLRARPAAKLHVAMELVKRSDQHAVESGPASRCSRLRLRGSSFRAAAGRA